jgi:hypothetical protein
MGSWEVHSVVGLVSAGEDTLWGVLSLAGGGSGRGAVLGCFGYEWGDSGWMSSIFRPVTPTGSGFGWWYTDARAWWLVLMRGGSVSFSVGGSAMSTFSWAAH